MELSKGDLPSEFSQSHDALDVVATVSIETADAAWSDQGLLVRRGTSIRNGQSLTLVQGFAELAFRTGPRVILEAPVELCLTGANSLLITQGKITVKGVASDLESELQVDCPSTSLRVADSEVGVRVSKDGVADIQVLSGSVQPMQRLSDQVLPTRSIRQGLVGRVSAEGHLADVVPAFLPFERQISQSYIAYQNLPGLPGNQGNFNGSLGMDFVVTEPIVVTKLGVFDSGADGLKRSLKAELWLRDEGGTAYLYTDDEGDQKLASLEFTPEQSGSLVGSSRFLALRAPLLLEPGAYTIVAQGYGDDEPVGNEGTVSFDYDRKEMVVGSMSPIAPAFKRLDDGDGAILFVGSARWTDHVGQFPEVVDPGSVNRYSAGTFEFRRATDVEVRRHRGQSGPEI